MIEASGYRKIEHHNDDTTSSTSLASNNSNGNHNTILYRKKANEGTFVPPQVPLGQDAVGASGGGGSDSSIGDHSQNSSSCDGIALTAISTMNHRDLPQQQQHGHPSTGWNHYDDDDHGRQQQQLQLQQQQQNERRWAVALFSVTTILLFADQNLMAPNLSAIAKDFGFDEAQRDQKLGACVQSSCL